MYKKILVPMDGSQFSECSLEHVRAIATGCQVPEVILLRVVEPVSPQVYAEGANMDWIADAEKTAQTNAENYVSQLAAKLKKEGVAAQHAISFGRPAEKIVDYARDNHVDLIIMSTHGRSGVSRWVLGSVADRVIHHSAAPVLVVAPQGCRSSEGG